MKKFLIIFVVLIVLGLIGFIVFKHFNKDDDCEDEEICDVPSDIEPIDQACLIFDDSLYNDKKNSNYNITSCDLEFECDDILVAKISYNINKKEGLTEYVTFKKKDNSYVISKKDKEELNKEDTCK